MLTRLALGLAGCAAGRGGRRGRGGGGAAAVADVRRRAAVAAEAWAWMRAAAVDEPPWHRAVTEYRLRQGMRVAAGHGGCGGCGHGGGCGGCRPRRWLRGLRSWRWLRLPIWLVLPPMQVAAAALTSVAPAAVDAEAAAAALWAAFF